MKLSKIKVLGLVSVVLGVASSYAVAADKFTIEDQRADEMRELVREILRESDRAMFLAERNNPVTINVHGFMQYRWTYNDIRTPGVDATHGFSVPRARLEVSGDVYDWGYKVSGQWSDGANFNLLDAYADWKGFRVGQFKSPFMSEVLTNQTDTLAADRSIIAQEFGQGRSQGFQYTHDFGVGTFTGAYTDGFNTANGAGVVNGYALTGRVDFDVNRWFTVGAAVSHNDLDTTDYNTWTVDATTSLGGFDFTGAYVATSGDAMGSNWGTVWTAAYDMGQWQPFVQYERGHLDGVAIDLSIATVGVNYDINPNMRWTTDLGYSFNSVDAGWNLNNTGWSSTANEGESLIRSQIQILF